MKIIIMLFMFCVLAFAPAAFAQTVNLFDAVNVGISSDQKFGDGTTPGQEFDINKAESFGTVTISCPTGGRGTLTGVTPTSGFIVDNFLTVNRTNICGGVGGSPTANCFTNATVTDEDAGDPVDTFYGTVGPINISTLLASGGLFTFRLMDYGGQFGSTEINLTNTNCTLVEQDEKGRVAVCHRNNRNKNGKRDKTGDTKTIFVDADDVDDHLAHGDELGSCR